MSHFVVLTLVDAKSVSHIFKDEAAKLEALEEAIAPILAPYDENTSVKKYKQECYCVGKKAQAAVSKKVNEEYGKIDDLRETFKKNTEYKTMSKRSEEIYKILYESKEPPKSAEKKKLAKERGSIEKEISSLWQKHIHIKEREALELQLFETHPKKNEADPKCEECKGSGLRDTTYNPKSKWDWYTIGGRWTGYLDFTGYNPDEDPVNFETCNLCGGSGKRNDALGKEARANNPNYSCNGCNGTGKSMKFTLRQVGYAAPVSEILAHIDGKDEEKNLIPFAIATQEGWAERGEMGWWACVSNEKDEGKWEKEAVSILKANKDKIAVVVDCHI